MNSVLIAYEDRYYEQVHALVKRLRREGGRPGLILEPTSVKGTGNFKREVGKLLRLPLRQTKRLPDRVVCVADADKRDGLLRGTASPPADRAGLDAWIVEVEGAWQRHLVASLGLDAGDAGRLRTVCLRWNKESLLIGSPDALLAYAQPYGGEAAVRALLLACDPPAIGRADVDFTHVYRRPDHCMDQVIRAIHGRGYKKGLHDEDLLREHILAADARRREELWGRCPDLGRLLDALE